MDLSNALKNLKNWSTSLQIVVDSTTPQIEQVFTDNYQLIPGCPSKASAALMCLRQVENVVEELNGALVTLDTAIRKEDQQDTL